MRWVALWFAIHFVGLIMMITVWGSGDVPVLLVPGLFGLIAGAVYGFGTARLVVAIVDARTKVHADRVGYGTGPHVDPDSGRHGPQA